MKSIIIMMAIVLLTSANAFAIQDFKRDLFTQINAEIINEEGKGAENDRNGHSYGQTAMQFEKVQKKITDIVNNNDNYRQILSWHTEKGSEYAMFYVGTKRVAVFYRGGEIALTLPPCCEPIELPFY